MEVPALSPYHNRLDIPVIVKRKGPIPPSSIPRPLIFYQFHDLRPVFCNDGVFRRHDLEIVNSQIPFPDLLIKKKESKGRQEWIAAIRSDSIYALSRLNRYRLARPVVKRKGFKPFATGENRRKGQTKTEKEKLAHRRLIYTMESR
jgi:hypothetical protein